MYRCEICNREFKNLKNLSVHITKSYKDHKITLEEYYIKYIHNTSNICFNSNCNHKTKFLGLGKGFSKFCSSRCSANNNITQSRRKCTSLKKYGVENPSKNKEVQNKRKQTCLNRYGHENYMKIDDIKNKCKSTLLENYGVEHNSYSDETIEKRRNTIYKNKSLLGFAKNKLVETTEIKNKRKQTCLNRYGVDHPSKSENIKYKIRETCLKKYGHEYAQQSKEIKDKIKNTFKNKYGGFTFESKELYAKVKETMLNKYGVENTVHSPEIRKKLIDFNINNPSYNEQYKYNRKQTFLKKYGVDHYSKSNEFKIKMFKKMYNNLFNSNRLKNLVTPLFNIDDYTGTGNYNTKYKFRCNQCNCIFEDHLMNGHIPRCLKCFPYKTYESKMELELIDFIKELGISNIKIKDRTLLNGLELDILIPEYNLAIELNGMYWHTENSGNKDKTYHLNKTNMCLDKNIQLIHIFEWEWLYSSDIIKSMIKYKLNKIENKIYARKCSVKFDIDKNIVTDFLNTNHIQGDIHGNNVGLYYNDELVSLIVYGKPRFDHRYDYEILRYCSKLNYNIIGGFSKLISRLPNGNILTYADRRYSNGHVYKVNKFNFIKYTSPSYYYIKNNRVYNRLFFRKNILKNKLEFYNKSLTEWQNMQLNGYDRIWDCGTSVFSLENKG